MEKKDIDRFLREMSQAMIAADASHLDRMIDDEIVLKHITGLTQTKGQWLSEIERGTVRYHKIKSSIEHITQRDASRAQVSMLTTLTATIWSAYATWRLRVVMDLQQSATGALTLMAQRKSVVPAKKR